MVRNPLIRKIPRMTGRGTGGHKSAGILDDHAIRKNIATKEGTIEKVPVNDSDIVNKKYVDTNDPVHWHSKLVAPDGSPDPAVKVADSGKVGIGTGGAAPQKDLHVGSTADVFTSAIEGIGVQNSTNVAITLRDSNNNIETAFGTSQFLGSTIGPVTDHDFRFVTGNDTKMIVKATTGRVGINKIAPTEMLEVDGTILGTTIEGANVTSGVDPGHTHTGGSGDVTAAANLDDNTIIVGDGGAKGIQDSSVLISELDTLTDNSMADTLHRHSELSASDGTPDPSLSIDADGVATFTNGVLIGNDNGIVPSSATKLAIVTDTSSTGMAAYCSGTSNRIPFFSARKTQGTTASPTATLANDVLFRFGGGGYGTTGFSSVNTAAIEFRANQNFTDAAQGSKMVFSTVPDGTITVADRMTIAADGKVGINTTSPDTKLQVVGSTKLGDDNTNYLQIGSTGDLTFVGGAGLPYGEIYAYDTNTTITITGTGIANKVQVTSFAVNGASNNMTPDHTNDHLTIVKAGHYKCNVSISAESAGGTAYEVGFGVYKNNGATLFQNCHSHRNLSGGGGDTGSLSMTGIIDLAVNDTIEVWVWNETNTNNVIVDDITMNLIQIGGT